MRPQGVRRRRGDMPRWCHISGASYIHSEGFSPSDRRRLRQSRSTHPLHKPAVCWCHISGASYIRSEVLFPSDRRRHRQSRSTHPLHKPSRTPS
ncbi:PREDICTED: uncharacterized protein LOC109480517 isoform X2 [Branchiostoma belcheri]|uniref:Uncharacterized protein LOC109480517 isoform X2 n=1 Tax=Branchiostoma belcheri TaxID=7741 RepID=A0A6P4ZNF0_BRABE|nr:PREDICTED: uncharacterized protein LOC109480517 isoform X2 [Branchiostoma belcheri]